MMNLCPLDPDEEVYTEGQIDSEPALNATEAAKTAQTTVTRTQPPLSAPRQRHVLPDLEVGGMAEFAPYSKQPHNSAEEIVDACGGRRCFQDDQLLEEQHYSDDRSSCGTTGNPIHTTPSEEFEHSEQSPRTICSSIEEEDQRSLCENEDAAKHVEAPHDEETDVEGMTQNNSTLGENLENKHKESMNSGMAIQLRRGECQPDGAANELPSPSTTPSEGSRGLSKDSGNGLLGPRSNNSRVTKSTRAGGSARSHEFHAVPTPPRVPTEEDLLLLLMRRQRMRNEAQDRLLSNVHQLQGENQRLKGTVIEQAQRVKSEKERYEDCFRQGNIREAEIKRFKQKYDKLKTWAHEMHKEYATIRVEGTRLSEEIADLKAERQAQVDGNTRLLQDLEAISRPVQNLKDVVAELQKTSVELQTTRDSLQQARAKLEKAKLQNKTHAIHIDKLEDSQRLLNSKFLEGQKNITTAIVQVSTQIKKHDTNVLQETMNELIHVVRELRENGSSKVEVSAHFHSLMSIAEEKFSKLNTAVASVGQRHTEHRTMQELTKTIHELKAEHAADIAKRAAQIRYKADEKVAISEKKLKEKEEEYENMCREKAEVEANLVGLRSELEAKQTEFSTQQAKVGCLEGQKQQLTDDLEAKKTYLRESNERFLQLESTKQEVENERDSLQAELSACEADAKRFKKQLENITQQLRSLQAQCSGLKAINDNNKATAAELARANQEACEKDDQIASLKERVESGQETLRKLNEELGSATSVAQKVPGLEETIRRGGEELKQTHQDITKSRTESAIADGKLTKQNQLVQKLEEEKQKANHDLERLASSHEQCGGKDKEIDVLKEKVSNLEKERVPLSTLMELLAEDEQLALTRDVVLSIKNIIHKKDSHTGNLSRNGEGTFMKPRRVADRSGQRRADEVVVQDSQEAGHVAREHYQSDNSDLSEPPSNLDDSDTENSDYPVPSGFSTMVNNAFAAGSPDNRPGTSNHEMLLRSSDIGGYTHVSQPHATVQVPASAPDISPMRTRQGSQIRHGTPTPQSSADGERVINFMTPSSNLRENHVPNSAAKRRQTSEAPESSVKRRHVSMQELEAHPPRNFVASSSTQTSNVDSTFERHSAPRTTIIGATMPVPGKTKKTTNSTRKTTKSAKMQAQFNSGIN